MIEYRRPGSPGVAATARMGRVNPPDPTTSLRRAARYEAQRRAAAAIDGPVDAAGGDGVPPSVPKTARRLFVAAAALVVTGVVGVAIGFAATHAGGAGPDGSAPAAQAAVGAPAIADDGLPVPMLSVAPAPASPCDDPAVAAAVSARDDTAVIAAMGGGAAFRSAVASGRAPCVSLSDPDRVWVVVNKQRPYSPADYRPADLTRPAGVRALEDSDLRTAPASALSALVKAAAAADAGEIGYLSAFRSFETQQKTYAGRVAVGGVQTADRESARAGYSEHQSGMAVDIVPCGRSCGTLDDVAGSTQGAWVVDHAWEYGFITRYVEGRMDVTGYEPEAWHLRYIGPDLARAYHEGGYTTLEEFFGLPVAPNY